jgi:hypothetical protein
VPPSIQRPLPFSGQSTVKGSGERRSPKATIWVAKRAVTCRTCLTSPCGENASTTGSGAARAPRNTINRHNTRNARIATPQAHAVDCAARGMRSMLRSTAWRVLQT